MTVQVASKKLPVSIGLPVYNGQQFLAEAIESILAQTFCDFELIISDNSSTDHTEAICRTYARSDPRIRYYRQDTNVGAAPNFNRTFELARGRYFKWCAHDDLIDPRFLERSVDVFERDRAGELDAPQPVVLVMPRRQFIDEHGKPIDTDPTWTSQMSRPRTSYHLLSFGQLVKLGGEAPPFAFALMRSDALTKAGPMGGYFGADVVLIAKMKLQGAFWEVPETLFYNRVGFHTPERDMRDTIGGWSVWYDAANRGRRLSPSMQLLLGHLEAIRESELSLPAQLGAYTVMSGYVGSRLGRMLRGGPNTIKRLADELAAMIRPLSARPNTDGDLS